MDRIYPHDDFEAVIRILSAIEGGRLTAPFNGVRWDFGYESPQPPKEIYTIHPDFVDAAGRSLPTEHPLPVGVELPARMTIIVQAMRPFHRARIHEGMRFFCHEGAQVVASGVVTRVTGLLLLRPGEVIEGRQCDV